MIHFHICWSDSKLDWEAFQTRKEAITRAKELVLDGETYVIEQFDDACPRCKILVSSRLSSHRQNNALIGNSLLKSDVAPTDCENCRTT